MVLEESVTIEAGIGNVWRLFVDLSGWRQWNTVLRDVAADETPEIRQGKSFLCSMRPFSIPVRFEPVVEEILPRRRIVWTGSKYGIRARHEFTFEGDEGVVTVTSRETFTGLTVLLSGWFFPRWKIRELTVSMLSDLKRIAEGA